MAITPYKPQDNATLVGTTVMPYKKGSIESLTFTRSNIPKESITMWINPSKMSVSNRKVISKIQTNTRWIFQHWGVEPTVLQYSGWTGYMCDQLQSGMYDGSIPWPSIPISSIYNSEHYKSYKTFVEFYEEPHKTLMGMDLTSPNSKVSELLARLTVRLAYRHVLYTGFFMNMNLQEDESSPWNWQYSMEFQAYKVESDPKNIDLAAHIVVAELDYLFIEARLRQATTKEEQAAGIIILQKSTTRSKVIYK